MAKTHIIGYVCTVTLSFEMYIEHGVLIGLLRQNVTLCVKNHPIPTSHGKGICCVHCDPKIGNLTLGFWLYVHYDLDLGDITWAITRPIWKTLINEHIIN